MQEEYEPILLAELLNSERYQQFQQHCEALALNLNRFSISARLSRGADAPQAMQEQSLG
ncbi:MAG: hypothetical protein ACR5LD_07240 [Symbiopectobacterium sp.]